MPAFARGQWSVWGTGYNGALWTAANPPVDPYRTMLLGFPSATVVTAGKTMRDNISSSNAGPKAIFAFATGGAFDTDRQQWVGTGSSGHVSVGTNEVNKFSLATGTWARGMNPTVELFAQTNVTWPSAIAYGGIHLTGPLGYIDVNDHYTAHGLVPTGGGSHAVFPAPVQQYGCICYMPNPYNKIFMVFGVSYWDPSFGGAIIFEYNVVNDMWQAQTAEAFPAGSPSSSSAFPSGAAWDSTFGRVLFGDGSNIFAYYPGRTAGTRIQLIAPYQTPVTNDETTAVWDPKRKHLVFFGGSTAGLQRFYDFSGGEFSPPTATQFTITGTAPTVSQGLGVLYDPVADRFVHFPGGPNMIAIDPVSFGGTPLVPSSGSVSPSVPNMGGAGSPGEGMWSRFFYASSLDAYVAIPQADDASTFVFAPQRTPTLNFTDLAQGPNTGNTDTSQGQTSGVNGALVTVFGNRLGSAQGTSTLTIGGVNVPTIYYWGNATAAATGAANLFNGYHQLQCIIFQIPATCPTGSQSIVATVSGVVSTSLPFTVTATGSCWYVDPSGTDTSGGTHGQFANPWHTIQFGLNTMAPGDILYCRTGTDVTTGCNPPISSIGSPVAPIAVVGYPQHSVQVGDATHDAFQIVNSGAGQNMTYAKLKVFGGHGAGMLDNAIQMRESARVVATLVQAPLGNASAGALSTDGGSNQAIYGNELTNCGDPANFNSLYHVLYMAGRRNGSTTPETNKDIGWNYLHDNSAFRGINMFNSQGPTTNAPITGHMVHHNVVTNQEGDGILFGAGVVGTNSGHDNLLINVGTANEGVSGVFAGVDFRMNEAFGTVSGLTTVVHCFNNTLLNCGDSRASDAGAFEFAQVVGTIDLHNNIVYQKTGLPYLTSLSNQLPTGAAGCSNNLWFGAGAAPAFDSFSVSANPLLVSDVAPFDLHLQATSPARNAAANEGTDTDFDAVPRPATGAWDIGAYQFTAGGTVILPPSLTTLVPQNCLPGAATFTLAIFASATQGFVTGAQIFWDGQPRTTNVINTQQCTITVPASDVAVAGSHNVTATNPGSAVSNTLVFNVSQGPVSLSLTWLGSIRDRVGQSPTALAPDGVFDACIQATVSGLNGRTITAIDVNNLTINGQWSTRDVPPTFVAGAALTLDGAYLNNPTTMAVNFAVADGGTFDIFLSDTTPPTEFAPSTQLRVTLTISDGATSQATVTVTTGPPTLVSIFPPSQPVNSPGFVLNCTGTAFISGAVVKWSGASRATTFVSPTMVQAAILASDLQAVSPPQTVLVSVTNPDLSTTGTLPFTITPPQAQAGVFVSSVM